jgi:glycosyltransferase involved in cell wall biosynthesis
LKNVFVIIPFYNEEKVLYLLLNQFNNKYKIILVNDALKVYHYPSFRPEG